ncbi:MAG: sel1 repeat family protein [Salinarimonas sp.]|nr:sel1 repeat family protein [Salinarimonas sp.]
MENSENIPAAFAAGLDGVCFADPEDFYAIGRIYALGQGRPADLLAGYVWLRYAAAHGSRRAARLVNEISAEMEHTTLQSAKKALRLIMDQ